MQFLSNICYDYSHLIHFNITLSANGKKLNYFINSFSQKHKYQWFEL